MKNQKMIHQPKNIDQEKYLSRYLKGFKCVDLSDELERVTQLTLDIIKDVSEEKGNYRYADGKWSIKQVIRHLTDTERIFNYRALSFSRNPESDLAGFDQDVFANEDYCDSLSLKQVMDEYVCVRQSTIQMFKTMNPEKLDQEGKASGSFYSARILGWFNAGHNIHHLNVLKERYV
jgi:uncharacterized damage-inducible protein DinB